MRDLIQSFIQKGMNALGDGQESMTYHTVSLPIYDAATGTPSVTEATRVVRGVPYEYTRREIDGDAVRPEDQRVIIAKLNLLVTPTLNDKITRADGTIWNVLHVGTDPMNAAWVLQIRRP